MKRQLAMVGGLLIACNVSYASDCSPGSPMYEDTFFKYCDDARAAYQAAATLTKEEPAPDAEAPGTDSARQGGAGAINSVASCVVHEGALQRLAGKWRIALDRRAMRQDRYDQPGTLRLSWRTTGRFGSLHHSLHDPG